MSKNDLDNYKMPKLGKEIARFFVNIARAVKASIPSRLGERAVRAKAFMRRHYLAPIFIIALVLSVPWIMLLMEVGASLFEQVRAPIETDPDAKRAQFYAMGLTVTGIGALLAPPFILIKAWVNERTATTAEQGHITERMTKAIEQLGAEKTVYKADNDGKPITEPNLEVRLGAIYALERIAQDSERDHIPIMETLCAYIRQNTNEGGAKDFPLGDFPPRISPDEDRLEDDPQAFKDAMDTRKSMIKARHDNLRTWANSLGPVRPPRDDVRTALTVIERRQAIRKAHEKAATPPFRTNITRANLQRADLSGADLTGADAHLARLEGADFTWANMEGANFGFAKMEGANLVGAKMDGANLSGANMEGADLRWARLNSADLQFWSGVRTNCRSADLTAAKNMTRDQVNSMFGDPETKLPDGLEPPDHWAKKPSTKVRTGDPEYDDWIARGAPPGKPVEN